MSGHDIEPPLGNSARPARKCHKNLLCDVIIVEIQLDVTLEPINIFSISWAFWMRIFSVSDAKCER
jgi:hypothetical protein